MEQSKALAILKAGYNVFLTGSAGAGKTYVLNEYIKYLKERMVPVAVTASTGIAATHMNGQTIHSWSGMGIKDKIGSAEIEAMRVKKYLAENLSRVKVLIIDEVSMLHRKQLDMVNLILKRFKASSDPFGAVQIVLSGDFFQLPPVSRNNEPNREKFAFMSEAWVEAKLKVCYLTSQHRQDDNALTTILNELRSGTISPESKAKLIATKNNELVGKPTELYTHNRDVDYINAQFLDKLDGDEYEFNAETKGSAKILQQLRKSVLAPSCLVLKKGAKVMFVKNDPNGSYMNGSLGEVVDFEEDEGEMAPVVKLTNGHKIHALPDKWSINNERDSALASFIQIPLRLGWAITVHKSQGMTLDSAKIDLSHTFERGQGYVALSRLKDLTGLKLYGMNSVALELAPLAIKADRRFQELSAIAEQEMIDHALETMAPAFVTQCGGSNDPKEIKKNKNRKKSKAKKKSTFEQTYDLIKEQMSLSEMAEERGVSEATIVNHIVKLSKEDKNIDIEYLRPTGENNKRVLSAYHELLKMENPDHKTESGSFRLGVLYDFLDKQVSYDELRMCLLFEKES